MSTLLIPFTDDVNYNKHIFGCEHNSYASSGHSDFDQI